MKLEIWTDGTSRNYKISRKKMSKKGISAGAVIIKEDGEYLTKKTFYSGILDNNQSEYVAFIEAVRNALEINAEHVIFYTDSNLIEKQMNLKYSANKESIKSYYDLARELLSKLKSWEVKWIPREENREADRLAGDFVKNWIARENIKDI